MLVICGCKNTEPQIINPIDYDSIRTNGIHSKIELICSLTKVDKKKQKAKNFHIRVRLIKILIVKKIIFNS
jgi:hypothetical protein